MYGGGRMFGSNNAGGHGVGYDKDLLFEPAESDANINFAHNFYILKNKDDRTRFRRRAVKQALNNLIRYARTIPGETVKLPSQLPSSIVERTEIESSVFTNSPIDVEKEIARDVGNMNDFDDEFDFDDDDLEDGDNDSDDDDNNERDYASDNDNNEEDDEESARRAKEWKLADRKRYNLYKLGPYLANDLICDQSWRALILLDLVPLQEFCLQNDFPYTALCQWIKTPRNCDNSSSSNNNKKNKAAAKKQQQQDATKGNNNNNEATTQQGYCYEFRDQDALDKDEEDCIRLGWVDDSAPSETNMRRTDPFFLVPSVKAKGELRLTRAAQRFLRDFANDNRKFIAFLMRREQNNYEDDGDEGEGESERLENKIAAMRWCADRAHAWHRRRFQMYVGNPANLSWAIQSQHVAKKSAAETRKDKREKELEHLTKQLHRKKGRAQKLGKTQKQKKKEQKKQNRDAAEEEDDATTDTDSDSGISIDFSDN